MDKGFSRTKLALSRRMRMRGIARSAIAGGVLVAVPLLMVILFNQEASVRFAGIVDSGAENVGPVEAARIVSVEVAEGAEVKAGDVLVRFDSAERLLDDALNEARIREYEQDLAKRRETLEANARDCRQLVHDCEVKLEEFRMQRVRDEAELAGIDAEIKRLSPLVDKKLVSELELLAIRPKAESLRRTLSSYEPLIAALERRLESAKADALAAGTERDAAVKDIERARAAVRGAADRSEALRKADPTVLKALADGVVSRVFRRPGDIVAAGEPVLRVKNTDSAVRVIGMLPAGMLDAVRAGDELFIARIEASSGSAAREYRGIVESVDSEVLDFFDPVNSAPRTPVRGRKARIRIAGDAAGLVPGETVIVSDRSSAGVVARLFGGGAEEAKR